MKRTMAILLFLVVSFNHATLWAETAKTKAVPAKIDMAKRTKELQELRFGMFICWSFSTFSGYEWTPGVDDINFFSPSGFDPDQWVRTAKEAGMNYILFLTKHHDGFCLWDTKTTDRKVTNAKALKGVDVLAAVRKACDKYGVKLALYFSEGDWSWNPKNKGIQRPGRPRPETKKAQLKELLTKYGPIEFIWFDHAVGDGGLSHEDTAKWCKSFQPGCFVGFNSGRPAGDICLRERGKPGKLGDVHTGKYLKKANMSYKGYRLAEFTYPILPNCTRGAHWFFSLPENDNKVFSAEKIYRDYLGAKKYGNIFSLDVGPTRAGKLRKIDIATLKKVGQYIRGEIKLPQKGKSRPAAVLAPKAAGMIQTQIDWARFLGRQDIVWQTLPRRFDHGVWHGNGLLGAVMYQDGKNRVRWELGRSDVTTHRRDNCRLPIGRMGLETVGEITGGSARLDLWNAESRGVIKTTKGEIQFRTFIHAKDPITVVDLRATGGEKNARLKWLPYPCVDRGGKRFKNDPPNPAPRITTEGDVHVYTQPRHAGGEFATAWKEGTVGTNTRRLYISIADTFPTKNADKHALAAVRDAAGKDIATLVASHRNWWHNYYPKSFVSVPDSKVEGYYWIQMHKLACATRADRPVMDLLGPWYRKTGWPRIWWNLNIQTAYLSVYTANHLEIGESLTRMLDRNRANFYRNAKAIYGLDQCATVPHTTDYEGLRGDGNLAPDGYINPGDFTWALHNYYLQYRFSMDHSLVTDQKAHAFYPLLRDSVNLYVHLMKKGEDGKWHLPKMHSPEYGSDSDNNYNLSLLRWACQTLIELNQRYQLNDPREATWRDILKNLVGYPTDESGLRIGANVSVKNSHRHWSHLLMIHPLHIMSCDNKENRALIRKSVDHWLAVGNGKGLKAWSQAAAASLYATMGDGNKAFEHLVAHHDSKRFVMPNGMYIEGAPVIECGLVAGRSLQDMLLQSWGGVIRVFPAVPDAWKEANFLDLRTQGAFLVSAKRAGGKTAWIRIRSLAGEPCKLAHGMGGTVKAVDAKGKPLALKALGHGVVAIALAKGQEALVFVGNRPKQTVIAPLAIRPGTENYWGIKIKRPK